MRRLAPCALALFGMLAASYGDTLTLRDGTTVTGSWLGADRDQINFLVGNRSVRYARSNVTGVTFGDDAPAAASVPKTDAPTLRRTLPPSTPPPPTKAPVAPPAAPPMSDPAPAASGATGLRPLDVVHFWDPAGPIVPLERAAVVKIGASAGAAATWEIKGAKSPYRIKRSPAMLFLVRLPEGADPKTMHLYRLTSVAARRPYSNGGAGSSWRTAPLSLTNAGDSIGLAPVGDLGEGEYAFLRTGSSEAYCFGIDAK